MLWFLNDIIYKCRYAFYIITLILIIAGITIKEPSYWGIVAIGIIILGNILFIWKKHILTIDIFDISIIILLIYEVFNLFNSVCLNNSKLFCQNFIIGLNVVYLIKYFFVQNTKNDKKPYFIIFASLLLVTVGIIIYLLKFTIIYQYGFSNLLHFRNLYTPLGVGSNEWGTILLFIFIFIFILFFEYIHNIFAYKLLLISIICTLVLVLLNISITSSRGVNISIFFFLISILLYAISKKVNNYKKIIAINILLIILFISFNTCNRYYNLQQQSKDEISYTYDRSVTGRLKQWRLLPFINKDYPIWGVGSNNYALVNTRYQSYDDEYAFTGRINNTIFQIIIEKGWIGSLLYVFFFYIFIYQSIKKYKYQSPQDRMITFVVFIGILTILVRELFFSSLFYNTSIFIMFLALVSLNCNMSTKYKLKSNIGIIIRVCIIVVLFFCCRQIYENIKERKLHSQFIHYLDAKNYSYAHTILQQLPESYKNLYNVLISERIFTKNYNDYWKSCDVLSKPEFVSFYKETLDSYLSQNKYNYFNDLGDHNIAWFNFFAKDYCSALRHINKALLQDPNIPIYYISKGFFLEKNDIESAFIEYRKALILSPDILWSDFFECLNNRYPQKVKSLLISINKELEINIKSKYSPIIASKFGCFLLYNKDIEMAFDIFKRVTEQLPNLSRPWFYLAIIYKYKQMDKCMVECLNKSVFLNSKDYLSFYTFADYYEKMNDSKNKEFYLTHALDNYAKIYSDHNLKSYRIYQFHSGKDEIIPQGFLKYIKPKYNILNSKILD